MPDNDTQPINVTLLKKARKLAESLAEAETNKEKSQLLWMLVELAGDEILRQEMLAVKALAAEPPAPSNIAEGSKVRIDEVADRQMVRPINHFAPDYEAVYTVVFAKDEMAFVVNEGHMGFWALFESLIKVA
jgi:hypothetical protein